MASSTDTLYITFVDVDRKLLKVWGQKNRASATYIERQLLQLGPEFNKGEIPSSSQIRKGLFCFAQYSDKNYYRARVISNVQDNFVGVLFIDYGNKDLIHISNIRVPEGNEDVLAKMLKQAEEYYLVGVVSPPGGWSKEIISEIRRDICYEEFAFQTVAQVGDQKLLNIKIKNDDFSSILIKKHMAEPIPLNIQTQIILSYCSLVPTNSNSDNSTDMQKFNFSVPPQNLGRPISSAYSTQHVGPSKEMHQKFDFERPSNQIKVSHTSNLQYPFPGKLDSVVPSANKTSPLNQFPQMNQKRLVQPVNSSFDPMMYSQSNSQSKESQMPAMNTFNNGVIEALALQIKNYIAKENTNAKNENTPHNYVNSVLEVGSTHSVFISCIDDGPWSFSVQLLSSKDELRKLKEELKCTEMIPIRHPVILGHPCVCMSEIYQNQCRGVIVSISHSAVKVYLVDYGNIEDLPVSSIYELPHKFFNTRVLSQKFCLSGLQKVSYSNEIKMFFKEVVHNQLLILRVTSLEGDNLPSCELYLEDKNIKRVLNEKIREARTASVDLDPRPGDTEYVVVTWVENVQKFYVQLSKREDELNALKLELSETDLKSKTLNYPELRTGLKCVCKYTSDGQWYRAVITSIVSESNITVFYFDYGNTEVVNISLLRKANSSGLINQMNPQAKLCRLQGYESEGYNQDTSNEFEALTLEKQLRMTVFLADENMLCVKLFDNEIDIGSLLNSHRLRPEQCSPKHKNWKEEPVVAPLMQIQVEPPPKFLKTNKMGINDKTDFYEKKDKSFRYDKSRSNYSKEKNGLSRHFSVMKSEKAHFPSSPVRLKKRFESGHRREEKWKENDGDFPRKDRSNKTFKPNHELFPPSGGKFSGNQTFNDRKDDKFWKEKKSKSNKEFGDGERKRFDVHKNEKGKSNSGKSYDFALEGKRINKKYRDWNPSSGTTFVEGKKKLSNDKGYKKEKRLSDSKSLTQLISEDEKAPPGSVFQEKVVQVGHCEKAIVTYYINPFEFYIQLLNNEEDFKKMMHDIQIYYADKSSIKTEMSVGDIVIAQFSFDNILYRAEVIKKNPLTVHYVDYGNHEEVDTKHTWVVAKQFLHLPRQVVKCKLNNLLPVGSGWNPEIQLDKFFESEEYECKFLSHENDVYGIEMKALDTGEDVASQIIIAGHGKETKAKLDIPKFDLTLLPKQILKARVSFVVNTSKFFVLLSLNSVKLIEEEIKNIIKNKTAIQTLDENFIRPDSLCLVSCDGIDWYRGTIVRVENDSATIWLNDRGDNVEVPLHKERLKVLPEYLKHFSSQAIECILHETKSSVSVEDFKAFVEHKDFLMHIISENNKRLSVILYDVAGEKIQFHCNDVTPLKVEPIEQFPLISQKIRVKISHLESPKELYIQRIFDLDSLQALTQKMTIFYEVSGEKFDESIGTLVGAKSLVAGKWYRGRVVSFLNGNVDVFYVDFGNKESLPVENVKKLDSSFYNLQYCARKVSLDLDYEENEEKQIVEKLVTLTQNEELDGYFLNSNDSYISEFLLNGNRITPALKLLSSSTSKIDRFEEIIPKNLLSKNAIEDTESELKVFVSHIDSPKKFWVHKEEIVNDLQEFQESLQKACETLPDSKNPNPGDVVAAIFSDMWYRAKVLSIVDNILTVQFIDYGNILEVDLSCEKVKTLSKELIEVPTFATRYSLKGKWKESATSKFEEMIWNHEDPLNVVVLTESDPLVVDLLKEGESIFDNLIEEDMGAGEDDCEEDFCVVYVTHSNSPDDFYIQKLSSTEILSSISSSLENAETFENLSYFQENDICVAKFSLDDTWYRARVLNKHQDEVKVLFIDYGNTSSVTQIKKLPSDIAKIPALSENYSLIYGNKCDEWSEAASAKFKEYVDGDPLKMNIVFNRPNRPIVKLYSEKGSISEELESLCEADGRAEVYVTHVNSPTDFHIQFVNDDDMNLIKKTLEKVEEYEDLEDKKSGNICLVQSRDNTWLRGKILEVLEDGFEVLLIDYGNVSVFNELKKAPQSIIDITPRAIRSSLILPEKNIPESVKEEFTNLTNGGKAVFRGRIIKPGEVNLVSLKLEGRIIEQTLCLEPVPEDRKSMSSFFSHHRDLSDSIEDGTDDDKNSKISLITESYLNENLEDDARVGRSLQNETDEEKRYKSIATVGSEGLEGFRSDDEKGIIETLSGSTNVTDNELIEEAQENIEALHNESTDVVENVSENSDFTSENIDLKEGCTLEEKTSGRSSPGNTTTTDQEITSPIVMKSEAEESVQNNSHKEDATGGENSKIDNSGSSEDSGQNIESKGETVVGSVNGSVP